jgi:hypothetical protein
VARNLKSLEKFIKNGLLYVLVSPKNKYVSANSTFRVDFGKLVNLDELLTVLTKPTTVQFSFKGHEAIVTASEIKVGCQTFTHKALNDLVAAFGEPKGEVFYRAKSAQDRLTCLKIFVALGYKIHGEGLSPEKFDRSYPFQGWPVLLTNKLIVSATAFPNWGNEVKTYDELINAISSRVKVGLNKEITAIVTGDTATIIIDGKEIAVTKQDLEQFTKALNEVS